MKTKQQLLTLILQLAAALVVHGQPVITTQPQSQTNVVGTAATFSVVATGKQPLSYQWLFYSLGLVDQTNTTLVLTTVQPGGAGNYTVVVTNVEGSVTSAVATLTVVVPPKIVSVSPTEQSVSLGANPDFNITGSGTPPLYYHLRLNQRDLPGQTNVGSFFLKGTLTVTNAQVADAGDYMLVLTNLAGSATSRVMHLEVDPTFTKITSGSIVSEAGTGTGCAWGDYDNDGFIDLIVTSAYNSDIGRPQPNILFHNNRDGTFTEITNTVVSAEARDWRGCSWVDYDNDGNLDLFVTSTDANGYQSQNELFRNAGNGDFTKMTASAAGAIVPGGGGSEGPLWSDYDRDGFVDLYVVRYGADWLFHNDGDGSFTKVPNDIGIPLDNNNTYRGMWGDYDNDGWPDLFLAIRTDNDLPRVRNLLYHGLGNGTFTNIQTGVIVTDYGQSPSCGWGDYDNDGYLDLFVTSRGGLPNLLYHNNGDGTFTKMLSNNVGSIVSDLVPTGFPDCAWGDYDNDGFLDLFVTTGDGTSSTTNYLYHNNGDGTFSRVLSGSLVNDVTMGAFSCAWGDYDNDGFLDLFVPGASHYGLSPNLLYRNNGNSNAWTKIKLVGTLSNRSAIGAKVRVQATIRGRQMWQMREINSGNGFSTGPLEAHFGLGDATNIDLVRIEWPSCIVQTMTNVAPRHFLTVVEHQDNPAGKIAFAGAVKTVTGGIQLSASGNPGSIYLFEASTNLVDWTKVGVRTNGTGTVEFLDSNAAKFNRRFYRVSAP
jgi:hypothetical protein